MSEERKLPQEIIDRCLTINDTLKTIKKALMADGEDIAGFSDHYSDLIQQVIDLNWENHDFATEESNKDLTLRKSYHIEMDMKLLELYSDYIISSYSTNNQT